LDPVEPHGSWHRGEIRSAAFAGPYLVTVGEDGTLRRWLAEDGTPGPVTVSPGELRAVAGAELGGKPFAVTGGAAGNYVPGEALRRWDLSRASPVSRGARPAADPRTTKLATATVDGRPMVLCGGHNGKVYLRDIGSGRIVGVEHSGRYYPTGIATGVLNGRPIAVISRWIHSAVVLWRLDTRQSFPLSLPDFETVWAVDVRNEPPTLITTTFRGRDVRSWNLDTGDHTVIEPGDHEVTAIALGHHETGPTLAIGRMDGILTLRDPRTGTLQGGPFLMPNPIKALAFSHGHELAVCFDGDIVMLRAWPPNGRWESPSST
jgi:WD40 repeat protein